MKIAYIEKMGQALPPKGTVLELCHMAGLKWYLKWNACPHDENIIQGWFSTAAKAKQYAEKMSFKVEITNPCQ